MNSFKKFLSIILCATSILSAPVNTFATGDSDLPNEKLAEDKDILSLSDEKLNNETENAVNEKLEAFEEILKKAFDENNESAIRIIKSIFDKDNLHQADNENTVKIIESLLDVSVPADSKIAETIKEFVELPMFEDIIADEKYKGLAIFKKDILEDNDLNIITKFMTRNDCFSGGDTIDVKGIMVHSTATPGCMADFWYVPWNKSYQKGETGREVCIHAFLDDKNVYQYLPWNHRGWHCGGKANNTHVSFEICEPVGITYTEDYSEIASIDIEATREYFEKAYENAVKLCVLLCKQFNLTEKDIICHCEGHDLGVASNHGDVMHWWKFYDKDMDNFRADVKMALENA